MRVVYSTYTVTTALFYAASGVEVVDHMYKKLAFANTVQILLVRDDSDMEESAPGHEMPAICDYDIKTLIDFSSFYDLTGTL